MVCSGTNRVGNHYCQQDKTAFVCMMCAQFFMRNCDNLILWNCIFDDNCSLDSTSADWKLNGFCRKCHLQKCFNVGMSKAGTKLTT